MKSNKALLNSLLKTVQMGQVGIQSVQDSAIKAELQEALSSQLKEYDAIEEEVLRLASNRGWQLEEISGSVRAMSGMMSRAKLMGGDRDSKIAGMMIQGNMRGIIKGLKDQHQSQRSDGQVQALSEKLLSTEDCNIDQMKPFL